MNINYWSIYTLSRCQLKRSLSDRSSERKLGVDYSGLNEVYMEKTSFNERGILSICLLPYIPEAV